LIQDSILFDVDFSDSSPDSGSQISRIDTDHRGRKRQNGYGGAAHHGGDNVISFDRSVGLWKHDNRKVKYRPRESSIEAIKKPHRKKKEKGIRRKGRLPDVVPPTEISWQAG